MPYPVYMQTKTEIYKKKLPKIPTILKVWSWLSISLIKLFIAISARHWVSLIISANSCDGSVSLSLFTKSTASLAPKRTQYIKWCNVKILITNLITEGMEETVLHAKRVNGSLCIWLHLYFSQTFVCLSSLIYLSLFLSHLFHFFSFSYHLSLILWSVSVFLNLSVCGQSHSNDNSIMILTSSWIIARHQG